MGVGIEDERYAISASLRLPNGVKRKKMQEVVIALI